MRKRKYPVFFRPDTTLAAEDKSRTGNAPLKIVSSFQVILALDNCLPDQSGTLIPDK